ncbi:zinc finger protein 62 homolog [Anolis sagrei]|uniref:zinc finger protein 62 homolog n=1 Tax=Anolis sagrei TaxID=38937 RepID=UPI00351F82E0
MEERVRKGNSHFSTCGGISIGKAALNGKCGALTSPCKGPCTECMTDPTIRGTLMVQSEDEDGGSQPPTVVHFGGPEGTIKYCGNCPVVKEEPEEATAQQWETKWQEFLTSVEDSSSLPETPHFPQEPAPWDDTPAFLASFEQVAKASQWPEEEWASRLLPTLKGEAELAFSSLEDEEREDYRKVKAAILRGDTLNQEKSRQCFRRFCYQQADGPRGAYNQLQEFCRQWLKAERNSKEQILELLILEQFLTVLPPEIRGWVKKHHLESGAQAVSLAEDYLVCWKAAVKEEQTSESQVEGSPHLSQLEKTPSDAGQRLPPSWESEMEEDTDLSDTDWSDGGISKQMELQGVSPEKGDGFSPQEEVSESRDGEESKKGTMKANQAGLNQQTPKRQSCCYVCGKTHNLPLHLYKRAHKRGKLYRCSQCQKGSVPLQQSSSSGKLLKCLVCEKVFNNKKNLKKHQKTHRGAKPNIGSGVSFMTKSSHQKNHGDSKLSLPPPEITVYLCGICEASFNSALDLDAHQRIHRGQNHSEHGKNSSQETDLRKPPETHSLDKPFECTDCGKRFVWMTSCNKHRKMHCSKKTNTGALLSDISIQKEVRKNSFPSPGKVKDIHKGEKTHQCTFCKERFMDSLTLEEHKKKIHKGKNSAPLLQSHISQDGRVHTGERSSGSVDIGESFMLSLSFESQKPNHEKKKQGRLLKSLSDDPLKRHMCLECGRKFDRPSRLKKHQFIHTGERPYQCTDCGEKFLWSSSLDVHRKKFHKQNKMSNKGKSCVCSECGRTFSGPTYLAQHQQVHLRQKPDQDVDPGDGGSSLDLHSTKAHDGKKPVPPFSKVSHKGKKSFACNICGKKFTQASNISKHQRLHTGEQPHQCTDCGERFMWSSSLNAHRRNIHDQTKVSAKKSKSCECPECGRTFSGPTYLAQHQQVHLRQKPDQDVDPGDGGSSLNSTTCPTCGKNFNQASDLRKHQRIHTGEKPYQCTDCGEQFMWNRSLGLHRKNFHKGKKLVPVLQRIALLPGEFLLWSELEKKINQGKRITRHPEGRIKEKPYKHTDSEESFISLSSLRKDDERKKAELSLLRSPNGKKEAHTCSKCKKSFEWASQLRRHLCVHSGNMPFQCPDCEECFTLKSSLESHRMKAHTGNKPHACSECGKSFDYPSQLKKHQKTHAREKSDPSANSEETSEESDTGKAGGADKQEAKYACDECGKSYNKVAKLKMHSRLHSGDKPYQCSECGERFMWHSGLYRHEMKSHKRTQQPLLQRGSADEKEPHKGSRSGKLIEGKSYLLKQLGIYDQEKTHRCSECGKCFWKEVNLTRHRQNHLRAKMCKYEYQKSSIVKENLEKDESPHSVQMPEEKSLQPLSHQDESEQMSEEESLQPLKHLDDGEQISKEKSLQPLSHMDESEQMSEEESLQPLRHLDDDEQMSKEKSLQPLSHLDDGEQMSKEKSLQPLTRLDESEQMSEEKILQLLSHLDEGEQMSEEKSLPPLSHLDESEQMSEEKILQLLSHLDERKQMSGEKSLPPLSHLDDGEQMSEEKILQLLSHLDESG